MFESSSSIKPGLGPNPDNRLDPFKVKMMVTCRLKNDLKARWNETTRHLPKRSDEQVSFLTSVIDYVKQHNTKALTNHHDKSKPFERLDLQAVSAGSDSVLVQSHWQKNSLFETVVLAYNNHLPLELKPDDIWLIILQSIAQHLSLGDNAEKYRSVFVEHQGKEEIVVDIPGSCPSGIVSPNATMHADWSLAVMLILGQIEARTKGDTAAIMSPDFSTTSHVSRVVTGIVIMDAMKHYFSYIGRAYCGIPSVTLHGDLADWQHLVGKLRHLSDLNIGLEWYFPRVISICENLVKTYSVGANDQHADFETVQSWWAKVFSSIDYGSGSSDYGGWLPRLWAYKDGNRTHGQQIPDDPKDTLDLNDLPSSKNSCPFGYIDLGGTKHKMTLLAGHFGTHVVKDEQGEPKAVRPEMGWAIALHVEESVEATPSGH